MAITIKSKREIELMRHSCKVLAEIHERLKEEVKPGISTLELDILAEKLIRENNCIPNFLHYNGFPASICASVNDEVVHGIPRKDRILKEGDIISIDCGCIYEGYHSDAARTHAVGKISPELEKLIRETENSFYAAIKNAVAGNHLNDICSAVEAYVEPFGYGVVRELTGHGIGTHMHEDPSVPNFDMGRRGLRLREGMTLAIEPMINLGGADVIFHDDGWTCTTADGLPSAHYENTILITDGEPEILTLL